MKLLVASLCLLATANLALAEVNYSIAKGQARRAESQTATASGNQPATATPAKPQPAPADPVLQATLRNIASLRASFTAIGNATDANAAAEQRTPLLNQLSAAAQGKKPASASIKKLAGDLIMALANRKLTAPDDQNLPRAVHALFNAAHLDEAQRQAMLDEVKKILASAGTPAADVEAVSGDLLQIATETQ